MRSSVFRFAFTAVLMVATGALLQARGRNEIFPPRLPLKTFPMQLGSWTGTNLTIEKEVLDVLGPLSRVAFLAGKTEIRDAIGATLSMRDNMLDLQRDILLAAIGAFPFPLLQ